MLIVYIWLSYSIISITIFIKQFVLCTYMFELLVSLLYENAVALHAVIVSSEH